MKAVLVGALLAASISLMVPARIRLIEQSPRLASDLKRAAAHLKAPSIARRESDANTRRVIDFAQALAAQLQSGHSPRIAWDRLGAPQAVPGFSLRSAVLTDDPADVLRSAAAVPGCAGLARMAVCWQVAEQSGAGLERALRQTAAALRSEREVAAEIESQLSAPRATGRLLLTLPLIAVVMGEVLGASPVGVLLTTPYGLACLSLGIGLAVAGWRWIELQIASVTPWGKS